MNNEAKNIIILVLTAIVIALVFTLIHSYINKQNDNIAFTKVETITVESINNNDNNAQNISRDEQKVANDEPPYGSKEYFDALYKKNNKSINTKEADNVKQNVTMPTAPIRVDKSVQKTTVPIGKSLNSDVVVLPATESQNSDKSTKPVPTLSPGKGSSNSLNNAAQNASNAQGIDALRESNFGPYMRNLQRSIRMNWDPPKGNESKRVVTKFQIDKNGNLISSQIYKSSGSKEADNAALNAIRNTQYEPLPKDFNKPYVDIQFTFDYNVFSATRN